MTNYNDWDRKAQALVAEAEKEETQEKKCSDAALGLRDGPQGPPVAQAKMQREEMGAHSTGRKNFIAEQQAREVVITHKESEDPILIKEDQVKNQALRIQGSELVTYRLASSLSCLKVFVEHCKNVTLEIACEIKTSSVEISHCSDMEVFFEHPVATVQCDECTDGPVWCIFQEPENVGSFFHQNCPSLEVFVAAQEPQKIGKEGAQQHVSAAGPDGKLQTKLVARGEKEFPLCMGRPSGASASSADDTAVSPEQLREQAEAKRKEGNEAFVANDFLQAAVFYTQAIQMCPELHLAWANRAQCFLKTGQVEKALEDSDKCTELAPTYAKGWFRKGVALHALDRFAEAVPALCEAEKLDPNNKQIPEAVRMAQLKARQQAS